MVFRFLFHFEDIVKSSMKNRSGIYGKTRKTLPLGGDHYTHLTQGVDVTY